jgi:hypothetical protein
VLVQASHWWKGEHLLLTDFMKNRFSQGTRLAAAILGVWGIGSAAHATPVYTQSVFGGTSTNCQFVALVDADLHRPPVLIITWGSGLKGRSSRTLDTNTSDSFDSFALFGRDSAGGVFVSFGSPGVGVGSSFENMFPGISESQLADDLLNNGPTVSKFADLLAKMPQAYTHMGSTSSLTDFSVGTDYGTFQASFSPVPEPASSALPLGAATLLSLKRRRSPFKA